MHARSLTALAKAVHRLLRDLAKAVGQPRHDLRQRVRIAQPLRRICHGVVRKRGPKQMEQLVSDDLALLKTAGIEEWIAQVRLRIQ